MVKVFLTELQKKVYDMYVTEGLNQYEIAEKIYGDKKKQGLVSKSVKGIGKKLGIDLARCFPKNKRLKLYDIEL